MAKKREKKDLKKEEKEPEEDELSIKNWIIKTLIMGIFMVGLVILMEWLFSYPLLTDTLIAVSIVITIGFIHEGLHYREAKKLGYEVRWYRTKVTMGFDIVSEDRKTWNKHKMIIGRAPYKVIIPISIAILAIGLLFLSLGVSIAGVASLLLHAVTFGREGKDIG